MGRNKILPDNSDWEIGQWGDWTMGELDNGGIGQWENGRIGQFGNEVKEQRGPGSSGRLKSEIR
jgi:hypothetical protein